MDQPAGGPSSPLELDRFVGAIGGLCSRLGLSLEDRQIGRIFAAVAEPDASALGGAVELRSFLEARHLASSVAERCRGEEGLTRRGWDGRSR